VDIAEAVRSCLAEHGALRFAVLFGSCAKGTARPESDVDLAIVPSGAFTLADEGDLALAIARATGRELDLVRLDRTEDLVLRREIARGVLVREGVPGAFARFRAEALIAWLDFEPVYTRATELYLKRVAEGVR